MIDGLYYNLDTETQTAEVTYHAFRSPTNYNYLTSVDIPSLVSYDGNNYSVTSIGSDAFVNITTITSITIPNSIISINRSAFSNYGYTLRLTTIILNSSAIVGATYTGNANIGALFGGIPSEYIIGDEVTNIGSYAFYGCYRINSLTISNSVTSIGENALYGCTGLTSLSIPDSVTSIGNGAFAQCTGLSTLRIPNTITSIGDNVFRNCYNLTSINIPDSVTSIGAYAFAGCTGLASIEIPDGVTSIGDYAFSGCTGLTSIEIPDRVTSIGDYAFASCTNLATINIPASVVSIGSHTFSQCTSLPIIDNIRYADTYLVEAVDKTLPSYSIKEGTKWIGVEAFSLYQASNLKSIEIPNSVISIGENAFLYCTNLSSVTMGNSVTSIGSGAFWSCTKLRSIELPNSLTYIGDRAFCYCTGLSSIDIPDHVVSIGEYAFTECFYLSSVNIGNGVETIANDAFYNCYALSEVTIGSGISSIGTRAFGRCSGLSYVTLLRETPPEIGLNVFSDAVNVNIYVPCGTLNSYQTEWNSYAYAIKYAPNPYMLNLEVNNINAGSINYDTNLTICSENTAIEAVPNYGYHFVQWSDGVTDNPRIIELTQDTVFMAEFALTTSGQCGTNLYWRYADGKLAITGSGDMYQYTQSTVPWIHFKSEIKSVSCSPEMTSISDYAFSGINTSKFNTMILPTNLVTIGAHAFDGDSFLETIDFGANLESIGDSAFNGCVRVMSMTIWTEYTPNVGYGSLSDISSYADLYVLETTFKKFQVDNNWNRFILKKIGAEETTVTGNNVTIVPSENSAEVTWPVSTNASTYTLEITKDGTVCCTLIFNASGQLIGIALAPGKDGQSHAPAAKMTSAGMLFTVTGLDSGTSYRLALTTKDNDDRIIAAYKADFTTTGEPQSLETISSLQEGDRGRLIFHNNQILILRGDKKYSIDGRLVH